MRGKSGGWRGSLALMAPDKALWVLWIPSSRTQTPRDPLQPLERSDAIAGGGRVGRRIPHVRIARAAIRAAETLRAGREVKISNEMKGNRTERQSLGGGLPLTHIATLAKHQDERTRRLQIWPMRRCDSRHAALVHRSIPGFGRNHPSWVFSFQSGERRGLDMIAQYYQQNAQ